MSGTNEDTTPAETAGRTEEARELAEQLVEHAQSEGLDLVGPEGTERIRDHLRRSAPADRRTMNPPASVTPLLGQSRQR